MSHFDHNAFEIRQLVHAQPVVGTSLSILFGVLKNITKFNLGNEEAVKTTWWPFVKNCFKDLIFYGFCSFYKKTRNGVVVPIHVPISKCSINIDEAKGILLAPKNTTQKTVPSKPRVFVLEEPDVEALHLNSPFSRLLNQYRRLSELSTNYMEEERRIARPVNFLEDTGGSRGTAVYQAVTAANPDWDAVSRLLQRFPPSAKHNPPFLSKTGSPRPHALGQRRQRQPQPNQRLHHPTPGCPRRQNQQKQPRPGGSRGQPRNPKAGKAKKGPRGPDSPAPKQKTRPAHAVGTMRHSQIRRTL